MNTRNESNPIPTTPPDLEGFESCLATMADLIRSCIRDGERGHWSPVCNPDTYASAAAGVLLRYLAHLIGDTDSPLPSIIIYALARRYPEIDAQRSLDLGDLAWPKPTRAQEAAANLRRTIDEVMGNMDANDHRLGDPELVNINVAHQCDHCGMVSRRPDGRCPLCAHDLSQRQAPGPHDSPPPPSQDGYGVCGRSDTHRMPAAKA